MSENKSSKIAAKNYEPSDYNSKSEFESGLAITHEQATDSLTEGTFDGKIENVNGKDIEIPRKGYEEQGERLT